MKKTLLQWQDLLKIKRTKPLKTLILPTTTNINLLPRLITTNNNPTLQLTGKIIFYTTRKLAFQLVTKK